MVFFVCYQWATVERVIILIQDKGILQNMSQFNLLQESFLKLPSIPNLNHTLLFIQTNRCFPLSSLVSMDRHDSDRFNQLDDSENSLQLELQNANHNINSASTIKKKKVGCTCKKTKCLKMYCECFSTGKLCTPECSCYGCSNDEGHEDCIRKAKEVIKIKIMSSSKHNHGKGCNCKKSQCQKKYCECFNAGLPCGDSCKCEECANGQHSHEEASEFEPHISSVMD